MKVNLLKANLSDAEKLLVIRKKCFSPHLEHNRHVYEKAGYKFTGKTEKINDKLTLVYYQKVII